MGSYQCKKCGVQLDYYSNIPNSRKNSCRIHSYKNNTQPLMGFKKIGATTVAMYMVIANINLYINVVLQVAYVYLQRRVMHLLSKLKPLRCAWITLRLHNCVHL